MAVAKQTRDADMICTTSRHKVCLCNTQRKVDCTVRRPWLTGSTQTTDMKKLLDRVSAVVVRLVGGGVALASLATGCQLDELPTESRNPGASLAQAAVDPGDVPSGEILFAELSGRAPSSSGFFFDGLGRIVVNVVDPADGPSAVTAIRDFLNRGEIAVANRTSVPVLWRTVTFSYGQLSRLRNLVYDSAFSSIDGIVSLDLDERANRVRVGALSTHLSIVRQALTPLLTRRGQDTSALVVEADAPLRLSSLTSRLGYFTWTNLVTTADTAIGGLGIGQNSPPWTCSVGFTADHPSWGLGFVTASHCTADVWGVDGRIANQVWGGTLAGTEVGDPGPWSCGIFQLCRRSDAAFFQRSGGRPMVRGLIARPQALGSTAVNPGDPYFIVAGSSNGYYGQQIYKIGYATGWTTGWITNTCRDREIDVGNPQYQRTVRCTNESSNANIGGDSGGPLFIPIGGPYVYLSGTTVGEGLDGSGTGWSTISQIQLDFGNALAVTRAATLGTPSVSGTIPGGMPTLNWSAIPGSSQYHIYISTGGAFTHHTYTASTSFSDPSFNTVAVLASPPPGSPWVAYYISAHFPGQYSGNSNVVYFQRPPAISATIDGQFAVKPNATCYWTVAASGGTGVYSYQWKVNGQTVGSNSSQLQYMNAGSSFSLSVTVSDGSSTPATDLRSVSVSSGNPICGF